MKAISTYVQIAALAACFAAQSTGLPACRARARRCRRWSVQQRSRWSRPSPGPTSAKELARRRRRARPVPLPAFSPLAEKARI